MIIGVYYICNNFTGQYYIGQTIDINRRRKEHLNDLRKNKHENAHLQHSYNKYGEKYFTFKIIIQCSKDKLNFYEKYYIQLYDSEKNGFNMNEGGQTTTGYRFTEEVKQKISNSLKGNIPWNKGKRMSSKHYKNFLKNRPNVSGKNNPMYGVHRYGKDNPMYGKHHSEESKKKMSKKRRGVKKPDKAYREYSKKFNSTGYRNVNKIKCNRCKSKYTYVYRWTENGKRKSISNQNLKILEEKVRAKGLPWEKFK